MGSIGGVDIEGYTFAEADDVSGLGPAYGVGKFDGICGMGWDDISVDGVQTPLRALVESGKLDDQVYAFYLGSGGADGELTIGGVNSARYTGDFHYVPVVEMVPGITGYWEIVLDDVQVGGSSISSAKRGVVDSGTSLMVVPSDEIKAIAGAVGAKQLSIIPPFNRAQEPACLPSWAKTFLPQSALSSSWVTSSCVPTTASLMLARGGLASLRL